MLGASFTAEEGKRVLALMGDINASPSMKKAQLNAFITAKRNQVGMLQRKLEKTAPQSVSDDLSDDDLMNMYVD